MPDDVDCIDLDFWVASVCASLMTAAMCMSRPSMQADAVVDNYKRLLNVVLDSWEGDSDNA